MKKTRMNPEIEWNDQKDVPGELNPAHNGFSVDVLVYSKKTDEHTIGWFDFNVMTWRFLCREANTKFKWRYFKKEIDKS